MNEEYEKNYWLVKPDCYHIMNSILNTDYPDFAIEKFKTEYKNGLYVFFEHDFISPTGIKRSHMPCPNFNNPSYSDSGRLDSTKMYLDMNDYKFMGEISRKSKLEKLKNINNE